MTAWYRVETMNAQHHLVYCPRQTPTCLVTSEVSDSIGNTPLIRLRGASKQTRCNIFAKAEFINPGGSIKDRIARHIVLEAEKRGELGRGSTIMEVTSGNTGIALAMVGAMRGYKVVVVMPRTVSIERRSMITSFGAKLELIEDIDDIQEAIERSEELAATREDIFLPRQFANPDMGVGRALRKAGSRARIIAVEPDESAVMSGDAPGHHGIQGLADGFVPALVNLDEIDQIARIPTQHAIDAAQQICVEEGLLVGISSGANVLAAVQVAHELGPGHNVVTVLCDRGERYLSAAERRPH